jgi:hypothetical protein
MDHARGTPTQHTFCLADSISVNYLATAPWMYTDNTCKSEAKKRGDASFSFLPIKRKDSLKECMFIGARFREIIIIFSFYIDPNKNLSKVFICDIALKVSLINLEEINSRN